jgi:DNA-binding MarR family transcriptional regulator
VDDPLDHSLSDGGSSRSGEDRADHSVSGGDAGLTHRPRALTRPDVARPDVDRTEFARPDVARPDVAHSARCKGNLADLGGPVRAPVSQASLHLGSANANAPREGLCDLRSLADHLAALAERLRSGELRAEAGFDLHADPTAGSLHAETCDSAFADLDALDEAARRALFTDMARATYARRRKRTAIFADSELFGEPAWDILLDLYIAHGEHKPVSVSSACIGSAVPPTTGLRWLGVLAEQGLIVREHDANDQRRVLVRLTPKAIEAMDRYFSCSAGLHEDRRAPRA